jgi:hypothetical protein
MYDTHKQDYLAQAERHIAMAQERIARQKMIIDELAQAGQETDCAVSMFHALELCLHAFEQHGEMIFERCKDRSAVGDGIIPQQTRAYTRAVDPSA